MSTEPLLQIDIDFLPARYREECAQRKTHVLRAIGCAIFGLMLLACSAWQWRAGRKLDLELEAIAPIHESAHERTVQLTTLKNELASASDKAELLIYLRHPWPRTQILATILDALPESIKLSELTLGRHEEEGNSGIVLPSQIARGATAATAAHAEAAKETPSLAQADLKQLRSEFDPKATIIQLAGETTNVSELHEYLGEIARHRLILKAELRSIESGGQDSSTTLFRARIVVLPGYGQPNGPTQPVAEENSSAPLAKVLHQARQESREEKIGS
jgi:hypothetical protein